ncbi:MAG: hypothetical protein ABIH63_03405 [archaeon]
MAKKEKGNVKKVNWYANYLLMLCVLSALWGYFTRAGVKSFQGMLFLLFFGGFFITTGYVAIKHKVMFSMGVPVNEQKKREVNKYVGVIFILIGMLLLFTIIKTL